jgi:hypothetical protein
VNTVIEHLCASQEHQPVEDAETPVIVYADRWGYCPAGAADGHDWRATGGRTLATVREWLGRPITVQHRDQAKSADGAER